VVVVVVVVVMVEVVVGGVEFAGDDAGDDDGRVAGLTFFAQQRSPGLLSNHRGVW
jgi:hypothetical protein